MTISVLEHRDRLGVAAGRLLIDGQWREGQAGTWTQVHPATNEEVTTIAVASAADVDAAVVAARRAFDEGGWATMKAKDRQRILLRIADLFAEHGHEIDELQTLDNGIPVGFSAIYQLSSQIAVDVFTYQAGWIDKIAGDTLPPYTGNDFFTFTLKEPVGVVAAIIPWNAPVMLFAQKVAPALAAGCTVVLKPSEFASLTSIRMAELCQEAGLPDGVLNLVTGPPDPTGEALITHPGVEKITFTGSRAVGTRMAEAASTRIARVSLELGGKSPNLIFDDVDVSAVAMGAMGMVSMGLSGQGCVCHTRALVQDTIYDDFVAAAADFAGATTYGDPFDAGTTSAALINQRQLDRVTGYIEKGQAEGATLVCGGDRPGGDLAPGNFVNPTLFAGATNEMVDRHRRDLRAGAGGHPLPRRGRGHRPGQRHQLRPGCVGADQRHQAGHPGGQGRAGRLLRYQRLHRHAQRPVRGLQGIGPGTRGGSESIDGLPRDQDGHHGPHRPGF